MSMSSKVFIHNGQGTSKESAHDLKELFTSLKIFKNRPDVYLCDFNFNMQGLSIPTFVVPGGYTTPMGKEIKPQIDTVRSVIGDDFNYVGICSGAFLGTSDADIFLTSHTFNEKNVSFEAPMYLWTTKEVKVNLGLIDEYKAIGSFYPNDDHKNSLPKSYMPYRVNLSLSESNKTLPQLYLAGPGFFPIKNNEAKSNVVATYTDCDSYTFPCPTGEQKISQMPAMICKKPTEKSGGIFLSGTHIEACVPNSKFLTFFKTSGETHTALHDVSYTNFITEQEATKNTVESLLRSVLK